MAIKHVFFANKRFFFANKCFFFVVNKRFFSLFQGLAVLSDDSDFFLAGVDLVSIRSINYEHFVREFGARERRTGTEERDSEDTASNLGLEEREVEAPHQMRGLEGAEENCVSDCPRRDHDSCIDGETKCGPSLEVEMFDHREFFKVCPSNFIPALNSLV